MQTNRKAGLVKLRGAILQLFVAIATEKNGFMWYTVFEFFLVLFLPFCVFLQVSNKQS
jgi:hypothetical protein